MKWWLIWLTMVTSVLLLIVLYFTSGNEMSVFKKQAWSVNEFAALMQDESMTEVYKPESRNILGKVGVEIILPESSLQESTVHISSYRLSNKKA